MKRLIACSLVVSLAALAGCNATSAPPTATPAAPPQVSVHSPDPSGVSVTGRGEAQAAPDVAFFDVGVELDAPTVGAARTGAAKSAERIIASLKKNGVAAKDIQTSSLSIQPRYDHAAGRDRITGYSVTTSVTVKARNLDLIGSLIDDAIAAGGNATRVNGIRFGFDDPARLRDDARQRAVADARRRAEELAQAERREARRPHHGGRARAARGHADHRHPRVRRRGAHAHRARHRQRRGRGARSLGDSGVSAERAGDGRGQGTCPC
jgi:uncharacterized protein YggE